MPIYIKHDFYLVLKDPLITGQVAQWMLKLVHLYQYKLALYIGGESEELQKMEMEAVKKNWKYNIAAIQEICNRVLPTRDRTVIRRYNNIEGQTIYRTDKPCRQYV